MNARTVRGSLRDRKYRAAWMADGDTLLPLSFGKDTFYAAPGEAPAHDLQLPPRGRPPGSVDNRFFTDQGEPLPLLGKDTIYGGQGQAPVYEWLVPKGARRSVDLLGFTDQHQTNTFSTQAPTFYGAAGQAPTFDVQLPPRGRAPGVVDNRFFTDQGEVIPLLSQDRLYGAPGQAAMYDQTLPAARKRRLTADDVLNLLGGTLSAAPPPPLGAHVNDGAPPARARLAHTLALMLGTMTLAPGVPPIATASNEPAPPAKRRVAHDWMTALVTTSLRGQDTFYSAPGEAIAFDWQLPPRGRPAGPLANRTHLHENWRMLGQDRVYGAPGQAPTYDWQLAPSGMLPKARAILRGLWDVVGNGFSLILSPPAPVLRGRVRSGDALRSGVTAGDALRTTMASGDAATGTLRVGDD